ncbi:MAG: hypothetical protein ACQSGP_30210, partial [Frankia sp.]
ARHRRALINAGSRNHSEPLPSPHPTRPTEDGLGAPTDSRAAPKPHTAPLPHQKAEQQRAAIV